MRPQICPGVVTRSNRFGFPECELFQRGRRTRLIAIFVTASRIEELGIGESSSVARTSLCGTRDVSPAMPKARSNHQSR